MSRQTKTKKSVKRNNRRRTNKRGGAIRMAQDYFGTESGRYFATGDPKLAAGPN